MTPVELFAKSEQLGIGRTHSGRNALALVATLPALAAPAAVAHHRGHRADRSLLRDCEEGSRKTLG